MYGGSIKELYTFYSSRLKQRQTYCCDGAEAPCLLLQRLKIPIDNNALCQEEKEIRELHLDFCRLEPGPRPARLMQPQQGSFFMFLFLVLEWALSLTHVVRKGYFLCVLFLCLYLRRCIQSSLCTADIAEGEAFSWGTDLSRPSKVAAGISDYLMGLADYEKAFAVGFLRKGKWPGGCLGVVKLCMKSWWSFRRSHKHRIRWAISSHQAGKSLDCPTTCRRSRIKYFSPARQVRETFTDCPFPR